MKKLIEMIGDIGEEAYPFLRFLNIAYSNDPELSTEAMHDAACAAFANGDGEGYYGEDDGVIGVTIHPGGLTVHHYIDEVDLEHEDVYQLTAFLRVMNQWATDC